jgi:predicted Zn-dependent protease
MKTAVLLLLAAALTTQAQTAGEVALGKSFVADLEKRYKPLNDPVVSDYLNALGKRLSAAGPAVPLTIKVVSAEEPLAAAYPGNYLVVSSGLVRSAGSESELAGMMAHQIAHIAAGHGSGMRMPPGTAKVPLLFVGGPNGICTRMNGRAGRILIPVALRQTTLEREAEADALARQYLEKSGYDPEGLTAIFQKLQPK